MAVFGLNLAIFGLILSMFLTFAVIRFRYRCAHRGPFGCKMTVPNSMKNIWTVLRKKNFFREKKKQKNDPIAEVVANFSDS